MDHDGSEPILNNVSQSIPQQQAKFQKVLFGQICLSSINFVEVGLSLAEYLMQIINIIHANMQCEVSENDTVFGVFQLTENII